jgi:hypothetical protein
MERWSPNISGGANLKGDSGELQIHEEIYGISTMYD